MLSPESTNKMSSRNARVLNAEAEEHEAKAAEYDCRAAQERVEAHLKRAQAHRCEPIECRPTEAVHATLTAYCVSRAISKATANRYIAEGMPTIPVGTTIRIDPSVADEWRRQRGRKPTTPEPKPAKPSEDDVDVSGALSGGGLRVVAGRGGR